MNGVKRKEASSPESKEIKKRKTGTTKSVPVVRAKESTSDSDGEKSDDFGGFSGGETIEANGIDRHKNDQSKSYATNNVANSSSKQSSAGHKQFKLETSSAEAHAKQRALAHERKASKPNADVIQRSKKIWERLRRKSHVPLEERKELVAELFTIITGRVSDFVFKHDSVRVIQCALKYSNQQQKRQIVEELRGEGRLRTLAQSRYGKFLVAKMVQDNDAQTRDAIIPEFYGHVKGLINHPEASWIVDDIYRQIATPAQKAMMLREWYGAEFAVFHKKPNAKQAEIAKQEETGDLAKILDKNPEKRRPILQHLLQMINALIQKKMTGFTMLHDAMLQYFLALTFGSSEQIEFLEVLKGDIDAESEGGGGDLFRNLSFTRSGSRLVCLALAYGTAKDRKMILRCFRDTVETMAYDQHGKMVLVAALDLPDDTKMSAKAILPELFGQAITDEEQRLDRMEQIVTHLHARVPSLYPLAGNVKWLFSDIEKALLAEVHEIRKTTSKKEASTRRQEIVQAMSVPLLELASKRTHNLERSSFGCQFVTEALLETQGADKFGASAAVAQSASGDPTADEHIAKNPATGRMLKTLVTGGNFDSKTKQVKLADPPLGFGAILYPVIKEYLLEWACCDSSFVIVALLESEEVTGDIKAEITAKLKKKRKTIEAAARPKQKEVDLGGEGKRSKDAEGVRGNAGAKILLEKIK